MKKAKRERLEAQGWRVGDAREFLGLAPDEAALIEVKLALSESLRTRRKSQKLTQVALARRLRSSQSRVAKMEAGDPTVTVDLLMRSLLALGARPREIARAIAHRKPKMAAGRRRAHRSRVQAL